MRGYSAAKFNQLGKRDAVNAVAYQYTNTQFVVTRDLPKVLAKYKTKNTILDYGCGTGLSSRFLKTLGFNVVGVDISSHMLSYARKNDPIGSYRKILPTKELPFAPSSFDLVVSIYVLFELVSLTNMITMFKNIARVLKHQGTLIVVAASNELYKHRWLSADPISYPENKHLKSGNICRIHLTDVDLLFDDYYWTEEDCVSAAKQAGFMVKRKHYPLGKVSDGFPWLAELKYPPFVFYELIKCHTD